MQRSLAAVRRALVPLLTVATASCAFGAQVPLAGPPVQAKASRLRVDPAVAFLSPYGIENFSQHYIDALSALLRAQHEYDGGDYSECSEILNALWTAHPTGGADWASLPTKPFGINIGSPPAYYGLRMLTDASAWRQSVPNFTDAQRTVKLTVVLVGESHGIEPQNVFQLAQGTGLPVMHTLEEGLLANESQIVRDSLKLFREYVVAMTGGDLQVETNILHLPDVEVTVSASINGSGGFHAGLVDLGEVWPSIADAELTSTDWWWLVYPSHVPEHIPAFSNTEFITGGMGTGPDSLSPLFIIDDRWLTRKPPHIGTGPYTVVERNTYLPQWLQHEFFHHLFRTYPEFELEATSHQWFNPSTWPSDFAGTFEADYYHEALYKRLIDARPPLAAKLRYATDDAPWRLIGLPAMLGSYERLPIQNNWHLGSIQFGPQLEWQNLAGIDWNLQDDMGNGKLWTGPDCPYFGSWNGGKFEVVLERDDLGDPLPQVAGFAFNGELYSRQ